MPYFPASIPRCQHLKVNGTQCGSPAIHRRRFCFFHNRWREQHAAHTASPLPSPQAIELPLLEDANSIQIALIQVMRLILRGQIEPKTAGLLLYALQTASLNLRRTEFEPRFKTEVVIDPRDVPSVPLNEDQWNPDDFEDDEEEEEEGDADDEGSEEDDDASDDEEVAEEDSDEESESDDKPEKEHRSAPIANRAAEARPKPTSGTAHTAKHMQAAANAGSPAAARTPASDPVTTSRQPAYRWVPPPGSPPLSDRQKAELRMLTEFVDLIAPLPAGEKE